MKKKLLPLIVLLASLGLSGCDASGSEKNNETKEEQNQQEQKQDVSYAIETKTLENAQIVVSKSKTSAKEGDVISFSINIFDAETVVNSALVYLKNDTNSRLNVTQSNSKYMFTMPAGDVVIDADIGAKKYNIFTAPSNDYTISLVSNANGKAAKGEAVEFTVSSENSEIEISKVTVGSVSYEGVTYAISKEDDKYVFTMPNEDVNISAKTTFKTYDISVVEVANVKYTVNPSTKKAKYGDTVSFSAVSTNSDVTVSQVIVKCDENAINVTENDGIYSFTMPKGAVTIEAKTSGKKYTVSTSNATYVSYSLLGDKREFDPGDTVSFSASPINGYKLKSVTAKTSGNTVVQLTHDENYSFVMPQDNVIITFATEKLLTITKVTDDHSSITISNEKTYYDYGDSVNFTISIDEGYEVDTFTVKYGTSVINPVLKNDVYSFNMPQNSVTITLTAKEIKQAESNEPFTVKTSFEGSWSYYNYGDYTIRMRIVFNGNSTLNWYTTAEAISSGWDDDWGGYDSLIKRSATKPSDMQGDSRTDGQENVDYTFDEENDQIVFTATPAGASSLTVHAKFTRTGESVTSITVQENLNSEYWQTKNRVLSKI